MHATNGSHTSARTQTHKTNFGFKIFPFAICIHLGRSGGRQQQHQLLEQLLSIVGRLARTRRPSRAHCCATVSWRKNSVLYLLLLLLLTEQKINRPDRTQSASDPVRCIVVGAATVHNNHGAHNMNQHNTACLPSKHCHCFTFKRLEN